MNAGGLREKRFAQVLVVGLLLALAVQVLVFMLASSVTGDEMPSLMLGYQQLRTGEPSPEERNPVLIMLISAAPLLALNPSLNPPVTGPRGHEGGYEFLYYNSRPDLMLFLGRLPVLVLSLLLGILVYRWAKRLYGRRAGVVALFFYAFSPTVISQSGLATQDLGVAFFVTLALYHFWKFCRGPSFRLLFATGVSIGLALASKHNALLLIPSLLVLVLVGVWARNPMPVPGGWPAFRQHRVLRRMSFWCTVLVMLGALAVLTINAVYRFQGSGLPLGKLPLLERATAQASPLVNRLVNPYTQWLPVPLPWTYLRGLGSTLARTTTTHGFPAFLMGDISPDGWWYYFPFAFAVKTPVPFLLVLFLSLTLIFRLRKLNWFDELFLLVPIVVMFILACRSHTQIGIRHLLVIHPLLFVFASKILKLEFKQRLAAWIPAAMLGAWTILSCVEVCPHYIAYFNELVGGSRHGYHYLVDSNVDLGQDVKGLVRFMDRKGIDRMTFGHWIDLDPRYAGRFDRLQCGPTNGWIAVQADVLQGLTEAWGADPPGCYAWLREQQPVNEVGYSILLYHVPAAP